MRSKKFDAITTLQIAIIAAIIIIAGIAAGAYYFLMPKESTPIKIGVLFCWTGAGAAQATEGEKGINVWVNRINNEGGLLGRNITVVKADTESDPAKARIAYERLAVQEACDVIFGPVYSSEALTVFPLANQYKVPLITWMSTSMALTSIMANGSYVWRPCGNTVAWSNTAVGSLQDVIVPEIEEYFENHSIPDNTKIRWQLIRSDDEAARDGADATLRLLNTTGLASKLEILDPIVTSVSITDFTNEIRIIQGRKADIVSVLYWGNQGAVFTKQSREYNSKYLMHGYGDVATSPTMWDATLEKRVGASCMAYYPIWTRLTNVTEPFVNLFLQYYSKPSPAGSMVYDTCLVYENAVKKAGTTDKDAVVAAIKDLDFIGVKREIRFDANHDVIDPWYALAQYQPVSLIGQGSTLYNVTQNGLRQALIWPLANKEADFWIPDYYVPSVQQ